MGKYKLMLDDQEKARTPRRARRSGGRGAYSTVREIVRGLGPGESAQVPTSCVLEMRSIELEAVRALCRREGISISTNRLYDYHTFSRVSNAEYNPSRVDGELPF